MDGAHKISNTIFLCVLFSYFLFSIHKQQVNLKLKKLKISENWTLIKFDETKNITISRYCISRKN